MLLGMVGCNPQPQPCPSIEFPLIQEMKIGETVDLTECNETLTVEYISFFDDQAETLIYQVKVTHDGTEIADIRCKIQELPCSKQFEYMGIIFPVQIFALEAPANTSPPIRTYITFPEGWE
jgi:hypothetical protein